MEGIDNDVSELDTNERKEMKGPSFMNAINEQPDLKHMFESGFSPDMLEKMQKNPKFIEMLKQQNEENRIKGLSSKERLRAKLAQKQMQRMTIRTKNAKVEQNSKNEDKKSETVVSEKNTKRKKKTQKKPPESKTD